MDHETTSCFTSQHYCLKFGIHLVTKNGTSIQDGTNTKMVTKVILVVEHLRDKVEIEA